MKSPKIEGWIYYTMRDSRNGEEYANAMPYGAEMLNHCQKTRERAEHDIQFYFDGEQRKNFVRFIDKAEYDRLQIESAKKFIGPAIEAGDLATIRGILSNNANKYSKKVWEMHTGKKLDSTWKNREKQLAAYYGKAWDEMLTAEANKAKAIAEAKAEKRAKEHAEAVQAIIDKIKTGESISGCEFVAACDAKGIKLHIRTRGFALHTLADVNVASGSSHVYVKRGKRRPSSTLFWDALRELREKVNAITADYVQMELAF